MTFVHASYFFQKIASGLKFVASFYIGLTQSLESQSKYLLTLLLTGEAIKTQVGFNAPFDPEGVKFDR